MPATVIFPSEHAAGESVASAPPDTLLSGVEIAVVFVEQAREPERHGTLNGILAQNISISLPVSRHALLPLERFVVALIDASGKTSFQVHQRIRHGLEVEVIPFSLCHRAEVARFRGTSHV